MSELKKIIELFDFEKGTLQSSKCVSGKYNFITASSEWKTHQEYSHDTEALIIAVAASGSLGRVHYVKGKFIASDLCYILTPKKENKYPIDLEFYNYVFRIIKNDLVQKTATGTSKLAINQTNFGNFEIPYFQINHQKKYKVKLINLEKNKDKLVADAYNQKVYIKNLRQQILQDAISGKLTEGWRKENLDVEPASKLLEKIKVEKEKMILEKKIRKGKLLPPIEKDEIPFKLPEKWGWVRLGILGYVTRGKSPEYKEESDLSAINQKCVRWGYVDIDFAKGVKKDWLESIDKEFLTKKDDLLVNSTGEGTIGRCAIVGSSSTNMIFDSHVLAFRKLGNIQSKYIMALINGDFGQKQINEKKGAKSTKQTELGVANLNNLIIPLPPLAEQKVIVERVENFMKKIDQLKKNIQENEKNADLLMQAVLQEAFRS